MASYSITLGSFSDLSSFLKTIHGSAVRQYITAVTNFKEGGTFRVDLVVHEDGMSLFNATLEGGSLRAWGASLKTIEAD